MLKIPETFTVLEWSDFIGLRYPLRSPNGFGSLVCIYECRCDERLKAKTEGSTRLTDTGLRGGLEHLKIETRLIDERFASVMGECEIVTLQVRRLYSK